MDEFDKIERLSEKAKVSFEEARDALNACGGDLLDAMVYLERAGKTSGPQKTSFSTNYEEQEQYEKVEEKVKDMKAKARNSSIGGIVRRIWEFVWNNSFSVSRNGSTIVKIPVWLLVILLFINWRFSAAVLIIALFFNCRYAFEGKDDMSSANEFMDRAGDMAEQMKERMKGSGTDNSKE